MAPVDGLADVPRPIDMVDVFRNPTAAGRAWAGAMAVVMDRCPRIELRRLIDCEGRLSL